MRESREAGTRRSSAWWRPPASSRRSAIGLGTTLALIAGLLSANPVARAASSCGTGDPALHAGTCTVTVNGRDFASKDPLAHFNFIVNVDNTKLPSNPLALSTESNSPIVREGDEGRNSFTLPDGRYLISARAPDHKMWGAYFTLPDDAAFDAGNGTLTETIDLTEQSDAHPLPLGKIRVFVFNDNAWTNGAPDTEEAGLGGFKVTLDEQTDSKVTVDYNNNPLCGGECITSSDPATLGFAQIDNLGPATYFIDVVPPDGPCNDDPNSQWYQTTTIDGGLSLMAPVEEGSDGTGAPGEQLWEPPTIRTAYWFGFVCAPMDWANPGTGEIMGTARNWVEWAPYTTGTYDEAVQDPYVALSDATTDRTVFVGQGDAQGNFDIQNVPAGTYNLAIWDEQLTYIMRFKPVTVADGETVDVNDTSDNGEVGIGVSRWFGWLSGHVYKDLNGNGQMDPGEPTIANTDMDQRWRDGSIKESTFTDPSGYYEYPMAEGGALGRWIINEQGFARFSAYPGPSVHDEHTGAVIPSCDATPPANPCIPVDQGGGLLTNQLLLEGHRATVDWGKRDYAPGTPGQIVGITYFATTRNEFHARFQVHEDYEPAIPDVTVYLETPGSDGLTNTTDDVIVNKYVTDHWQQPNTSQDPQPNGNSFTQSCNPIRDFGGADVTAQFNPKIGPNCLEVPLTGEQTKDGAFDGGYAFADYCPNGYDMVADNGTCIGGGDPVPLVAGDYITHVIMPKDLTDNRDCNNPGLPAGDVNVTAGKGDVPGNTTGCLYRIVKEEDVNVDLGNHFAPQIPPPPCVGDDHVIDQSTLTPRSVFYTGDQSTSPSAPLCDKHLVVLQNGQNANADFFMMSNFNTDPNGTDPNDTRAGDVAEPGRLVGQVFNDIYFERNPASPWYGEPRPIGGIPVGIYARVDTVPNVNQPYTPDRWRLLKTVTTSPDGSFEVLVPSTETLNCPIPQGPCPGMYLVTVDDPGTKEHPNANFEPNLLVATTPAEAWPGLSTQLDLPLDPISGTGCEFPPYSDPSPPVPIRPELLQVSRPYVTSSQSGSARRITIAADFIGTPGPAGATGGRVTLTDAASGNVTILTRANGGIVSWTQGSSGPPGIPDTIVIQIPAVSGGFRAGQKQLAIVTANANGGGSTVNGITLHVLGSGYNPPIVNVPPPPPAGSNAHAIQDAIDGAAAGSLLVLSPGVYNENVIVWKPLKLEGVGPGGIIGAHELQQRTPEDPRFHVVGSMIDGRFFQQNAAAYDVTVAAHAPYAGVDASHPVLRGADITVLAKSRGAYDIDGDDDVMDEDDGSPAVLRAARIDGIGLTTGRGEGAGGIQLQAYANNVRITNDVLENNSGVFAGGIGIGQPYRHIMQGRRNVGSRNHEVHVTFDRVIGNGGLTSSGGIGIFYGSDGYNIGSSVFCSNFGVEYGAGISHWGLSPGGKIHDNQVYYNDAVDSGAGVSIQTELPVGGGLGTGSGPVDVDRNLIQMNYSGDDGGGIFIQDALDKTINIRNNMIFDNGAADLGGAIMLDDSSKVRIVNNTVANNASTGSSENSDGKPHGAGLTAEANDPLFQAMLPSPRTDVNATTTNNSTLVLDPAITNGDLGKNVSGPGIPAGAMILSVTPGVSFVMSLPATTTASGVAVTIAAPDFSNPLALFNNIFWDNNALTLSQPGPGATLVDQGFIDFEIFGTTDNTDTFTPRYSDLTNGQILGPDGVLRPVPGGQGNTTGADPNFVSPFTLDRFLVVTGSRLDPQVAAVTITGQDPPVGLNGGDFAGDYHLIPPATPADLAASPVIDRGARCSNWPVPAPAGNPACTAGGIQAPTIDFDGQTRPIIRVRPDTRWDIGADEV